MRSQLVAQDLFYIFPELTENAKLDKAIWARAY